MITDECQLGTSDTTDKNKTDFFAAIGMEA
jgi:hypothetical protein